jgi:predicted transcriptional regulator
VSHDEFLQLVYDRFRAASAWPPVSKLQVALRPTNVRLLAAQIGTETVVCEEAADGVCFLQLEGLARCPKAKDDIDTFVAAIRVIAESYIKDGIAPVTSEALSQILALDTEGLRRLGLILFRNSGGWSGGSWKPDGSQFSLNPTSEAVFYEHVGTLEQFFETRRKVAEDAIATAAQRMRPLRAILSQTDNGEPDREDTTPDQMRVFISWSGERSHKLALLLHDWLPSVMQAVKPYVSSENIEKGTRWPINLARELEQSAFGILCIVPGNTDAPWLNFEAGALSKIVRDTRVVPLLFGVEPSALLGHPLGQFQAAVFEKSDVFKTLKSMNEQLGSTRELDPERLRSVFEQWWPQLAQQVAAVPHDETPRVVEHDRRGSESVPELSGTARDILAMWANQKADLKLYVTHVVGVLKISEQRATFYLDKLADGKYLHGLHATGRPTQYMITGKGREFLINADLA